MRARQARRLIACFSQEGKGCCVYRVHSQVAVFTQRRSASLRGCAGCALPDRGSISSCCTCTWLHCATWSRVVAKAAPTENKTISRLERSESETRPRPLGFEIKTSPRPVFDISKKMTFFPQFKLAYKWNSKLPLHNFRAHFTLLPTILNH